MIDWRSGLVTFAGRTFTDAYGVILLSGATTPPTVLVFGGTPDSGRDPRAEFDRFIDRLC